MNVVMYTEKNMKIRFRVTPGRELLMGLVIAVLFALGTYAKAAEATPLFRYVSEKSGTESYAARPEHRKIQDAKKDMIIQMMGYVYLSQQKGTVPLYGLRRNVAGGPMQTRFTASEAEYQELMTSGQWKSYFANSPVICYVNKGSGKSLLGAYRFTQTNVSGDEPRYRFEGKELAQWKQLPNMKFNASPDFYIWKDKPSSLLIGGVTMTTDPGLIGAVAGITDQTIRMALYNNGKDSKSINTKNGATYSGQALVIRSSEAVTCDADRCLVNLGWFVDRNQIDAELKTFVSVTGGHSDTGAYATFAKGNASVPMVVTVPLKFGLNHISLEIKPEKAGDDINLKNNVQKFRVVLEHSLMKATKAKEALEPVDESKPKVDITIRKALYFLGADAKTIDTKRPYGTPGTPLVLYKKDAIACNSDMCSFNFGFTGNRPNGNGKLDITALIMRNDGLASATKLQKIYSFVDGQRSYAHIQKVGLKMGSNKVVFGMGAAGDYYDSDGTNNAAEIEVIVKE
jgi:hypothetical protein